MAGPFPKLLACLQESGSKQEVFINSYSVVVEAEAGFATDRRWDPAWHTSCARLLLLVGLFEGLTYRTVLPAAVLPVRNYLT